MAKYYHHLVLLGCLAVLAFAGASAASDGIDPAAPTSCTKDIMDLAGSCERYVMNDGTPPSQPSEECCVAMRNADVPCVCNYVTPPVELLISMEKVVFSARHCGITIAAGTKCGSYTVPSDD